MGVKPAEARQNLAGVRSNRRLADLNQNQQLFLAAWWALADAVPPRHGEPLPLDLSLALSELSKSSGKYRKSRKGARRAVGGRVRRPASLTALPHVAALV